MGYYTKIILQADIDTEKFRDIINNIPKGSLRELSLELLKYIKASDTYRICWSCETKSVSVTTLIEETALILIKCANKNIVFLSAGEDEEIVHCHEVYKAKGRIEVKHTTLPISFNSYNWDMDVSNEIDWIEAEAVSVPCPKWSHRAYEKARWIRERDSLQIENLSLTNQLLRLTEREKDFWGKEKRFASKISQDSRNWDAGYQKGYNDAMEIKAL